MCCLDSPQSLLNLDLDIEPVCFREGRRHSHADQHQPVLVLHDDRIHHSADAYGTLHHLSKRAGVDGPGVLLGGYTPTRSP